jgi:hypothetical protein
VRYARVDGLGVFLDLRTSTYKVLDEVATSMLDALTGAADPEAELAGWCREYEIDPETARAELARFADTCVSDGLLGARGRDDGEPAPPSAEPLASAPRGPRVGRAVHALAATWRSLRADGFGPTYERYARIPVAPAASAPGACVRAFVRAENVWPSKRAPDDCLLRSLALFRYLRGEGVAAEHVIGVWRFPFLAHAWVECGGAPMLDERVSGFTPLARIAAADAAAR